HRQQHLRMPRDIWLESGEQSRMGCVCQFVSWPQCVRSILTEAGNRTPYESRDFLCGVRVPKTTFIQIARPIVLHKHVGPGCEPTKYSDAPGVVKVHGDRTLSGTQANTYASHARFR